MQSPLPLFGPAHLLILALVVGTGLLAAGIARRRPASWSFVRWVLVVATAALGLSWYLDRIFLLHQPWQWALPLELCDWSLWITVAALVRPRQWLLELSYFWGIAGASLALLMPYLVAPLLSIPSLTFLAGHGLIVASVLFLLGTGRMHPRPRAWILAMAGINCLALFVYGADRLLRANYMYLVHKPPIHSLFNIMGPWPWYILACEGLALTLFGLLQWPFRKPSVSPATIRGRSPRGTTNSNRRSHKPSSSSGM